LACLEYIDGMGTTATARPARTGISSRPAFTARTTAPAANAIGLNRRRPRRDDESSVAGELNLPAAQHHRLERAALADQQPHVAAIDRDRVESVNLLRPVSVDHHRVISAAAVPDVAPELVAERGGIVERERGRVGYVQQLALVADDNGVAG
jgi:hypothetical protein